MVFLGIIDTSPQATTPVVAPSPKMGSTPLASMQDLAPLPPSTSNDLNNTKKREGREDRDEAPTQDVMSPKPPRNQFESTPKAEEDLEERDFDVDPTNLFILLQKKEWEASQEWATTHKEEASIWVSRKEKNGTLRWKLLPLHASIVFKAPPSVIETLLVAFANGAKTKDDQGMLPLHLAFRNGSSPDIVDLLLTAFPESIQSKDRKGRVPLVLAQASSSPHKAAYLEALSKGTFHYTLQAVEYEKAAVIRSSEAEKEALFQAAEAEKEALVDAAEAEKEVIIQSAAAEKEAIILAALADKEASMAEQQASYEAQLKQLEVIIHAAAAEKEAIVLAALADKEASMAEQQASYEAQLKQVEQQNQETLQKFEQAKAEAERDQLESQAKIETLEKFLAETHESSQVLIAHVGSLEAQLASHADSEKDVLTKINLMEIQLKKAAEEKGEMNAKLELATREVVAECDSYKKQLHAKQNELEQVQSSKSEQLSLFEKRQGEWTIAKTDLETRMRNIQIDWATAKANSAILDAQLKKKMETEQALATQVSVLASQLAETSQDRRDISTNHASKVCELEEERDSLKATIQDLNNRLITVARVLEEMTYEQATIVANCMAHETMIGSALSQHAQIITQVHAQSKSMQKAEIERQEMRRQLEAQEKAMQESETRRVNVMQAVVAQSETMTQTQTTREAMVTGISHMGHTLQSVLDSIKPFLPERLENGKE